MNPKLQQQFDLLEQSRKEILQQVSRVDTSAFKASLNNKWSLGEVLIHIITSEKLALQYMQKKSLGVDSLANAGFLEPLKLLLLRASQRLPLKYKVPKVIKEKTPEAPGKEELLKHWEENRNELKAFLSKIDDKHLDKKIFKHPIAGMFNAAQGVAFLREHLIHHKPQIQRLVNKHKVTPNK
jgi:uncharacterized damage-inducible protein DinB